MAELGSTLDYAKIAIDTQAMPAHGGVDPAARLDRVGAVGYCMSGRFAYAAAGIFPDRIRAAASIYGVRLHGEHHRRGVLRVRGAGRERAEGNAPREMVDGLEAHLRKVGANARVEWYPGCHHGFAHRSRG